MDHVCVCINLLLKQIETIEFIKHIIKIIHRTSFIKHIIKIIH